jgi:hypothetical protein
VRIFMVGSCAKTPAAVAIVKRESRLSDMHGWYPIIKPESRPRDDTHQSAHQSAPTVGEWHPPAKKAEGIRRVIVRCGEQVP